jgi:dGTPase
MDWADDIAYSVHDVEDFYRAGLIPLDRFLTRRDEELDEFLDAVKVRWAGIRTPLPASESDLKDAFLRAINFFPLTAPYSGTRRDRAALRTFTSTLIDRYSGAVVLDPEGTTSRGASSASKIVRIDEQYYLEVTILKELTWRYVINNDALASQQHGQRTVISSLFKIYAEAAAETKLWHVFPPGVRERLVDARENRRRDESEENLRTVADLIASMTEQEAIRMYGRLTGHALGSVMQLIVR